MEQIVSQLLSDYGLLGLGLAGSVIINVFLYKKVQELQETILTDTREDRTKLVLSLHEATRALDQNTAALLKVLKGG